jgi:hypothetical protein
MAQPKLNPGDFPQAGGKKKTSNKTAKKCGGKRNKTAKNCNKCKKSFFSKLFG